MHLLATMSLGGALGTALLVILGLLCIVVGVFWLADKQR